MNGYKELANAYKKVLDEACMEEDAAFKLKLLWSDVLDRFSAHEII